MLNLFETVLQCTTAVLQGRDFIKCDNQIIENSNFIMDIQSKDEILLFTMQYNQLELF